MKTSTNKSTNKHRTRTASLLIAGVLAAGITAGAVAPAFALPAPSAAPTAAAAPAHVDGNLKWDEVGSKVTVINKSNHTFKGFKPGEQILQKEGKGKMSAFPSQETKDVYFSLPTDNGNLSSIAHNPMSMSAYLKLGHAEFSGDTRITLDGSLYQINFASAGKFTTKCWTISYLGKAPFDHSWVHHYKSEEDGVKGYVVNETGKDVRVKVGGCDIDLKKDQRLVYFDSDAYGDGRGAAFDFRKSGEAHQVASIRMSDPYVGYPIADVDLGGKHNYAKYSEGEERTYGDAGSGIKITVKRHADAKLPVLWEDYGMTSDWALFDITLR